MIEKTLGHYRVGEQLGRGGMGEVYMADDLNLNRKVALKFLPDAFAADPERMARFEREAKLLASLNHPNIAAIHGLEQAEGKRFLVLELVEGETLAQRLSKGALPVEEALGICRQIAEALEAAHEKGVIHRDLKPANVMITAGDKVKILDFGLAKALSDETQSVDSSQSPTLTEAMTRPGVILGTAAYMSPEQAKGKAVDKRADIWAFGCILYECLTGNRAFEGETVTETLASVLTREPEWEKIPAKVRPLLRRCLERDPKKRLRDIGDAWQLLDVMPESTQSKQVRLWVAWSVATLCVLIAIVLAFVLFRQPVPLAGEPTLLQIDFPDKVIPGPMEAFALSPDGRRLAFDAVGSDGVHRLWVRFLDSIEARPLLGTESNSGVSIFWSPDSHFVVFEAERKLKKIDVSGGPAKTICDLSGTAVGGSWNSADEIIFGYWGVAQGSMRVSASGGTASPLTMLDPARHEEMHGFPTFLADGRHFLYLCTSDIAETAGVYIGSLDIKPGEKGSKKLMPMNFAPVYLPSTDSGPAQLLFLNNQTLMAQRFDDKRMELIGDPIPIAEQVGSSLNFGFFSASTNGVLICRRGGSRLSQLTWFDRQGKASGTVGEPGNYWGVALSPNGAIAALSRLNPAQPSASYSIWLNDFAKGTNTQLTFGKGHFRSPAWSPDGSCIIFVAEQDGRLDLCQKLTGGTKQEELLLKAAGAYQTCWSSDGRFLLYGRADPKTAGDLWILPLQGDHKPKVFLNEEFTEADGRFSPDMRWVAYVSDESGRNEIYVRGFSKATEASWELAGKWQVSVGGGIRPRWRRDSKELYYIDLKGSVMAVEFTADSVVPVATPRLLFQGPLNASDQFSIFGPGGWDVFPDGSKFLIPAPVAESSPSPFTVTLNWTALLKK